jgi:hypothetical protein
MKALVAECVPLASRESEAELVRILQDRKFHLTAEERQKLLAEYLPFCEICGSHQEVQRRVPGCEGSTISRSSAQRESGLAGKRRSRSAGAGRTNQIFDRKAG